MARSSRFAFIVRSSLLAGVMLSATDAIAQQPPPQQQPYPPQPQPYPQQPYPPQPQPYPQQQQPYPPQPYPAQPYPPQPQPYPGQYPAQPYPGQPGQPYPGQPGPYPPPPPPVQTTRGQGEMIALYVTSALYGIGTGIWLDALFKLKDPGLAIILPITFGVGAPVGVWAWDTYGGPIHRGVAASTSAGLVLGGLEGMAIAGTQWQYTHEKPSGSWSFQAQTTVTWIMATGGGVGGWAFGEWLRPDPRSMTFIGSGAAWGALSGSMLGIAAQGRHDDWKDGSSIAGLIGYNVGIAGAGALSILHTPSYNAQKYMWMGYVIGALAGCIVFPFYLFVDNPNVKTGLIGPSLGGLAGVAVAGALTYNKPDDDGTLPTAKRKLFKSPFDVAMGPIPALTPPTTSVSASSRSISESVGPSSFGSNPPPGAMMNVIGSF